MQIGVILALAFSILIAVFAILNNEIVVINYLFGKAPVSVVIVILASALLGALVVGLFSLVARVKQGLALRDQQKRFTALEARLAELQEREAGLAQEVSRLESQLCQYQEEEGPELGPGDSPKSYIIQEDTREEGPE